MISVLGFIKVYLISANVTHIIHFIVSLLWSAVSRWCGWLKWVSLIDFDHTYGLWCKMSSKWFTWWRHQMKTFSALLAICAGNLPVTNEFPAQRSVTRSFGVLFHLRLYKRLSKQSWGWRFETPSCPLWCHCNDHPANNTIYLAIDSQTIRNIGY